MGGIDRRGARASDPAYRVERTCRKMPTKPSTASVRATRPLPAICLHNTADAPLGLVYSQLFPPSASSGEGDTACFDGELRACANSLRPRFSSRSGKVPPPEAVSSLLPRQSEVDWQETPLLTVSDELSDGAPFLAPRPAGFGAVRNDRGGRIDRRVWPAGPSVRRPGGNSWRDGSAPPDSG